MSGLAERLYESFAGAALGTFVGDALGMPVEGWPPDAIRREYVLLDDLVDGRFPAGSYTDDTEMMIGLLEALVEAEGFDGALAAKRFLANFHPNRGYGGRIYDLMDRLSSGTPWDQVGTDSFGNGSAMRVAPVGFYFYYDLEAVKKAAVAQAMITHQHPEALAGAVIQAGAVALNVRAYMEGRKPEPDEFLGTLADLSRDLDENSAERLLGLKDLEPGEIETLVPKIRKKYRCNVKAIEAVGPAVGSFLATSKFSDAVILAVNLGGDTDTVGAMAGAITGAWYGLEGIDPDWLAKLENGRLGRDHVMNLCRKAAKQVARKAQV
jgi:poly(ADP-ribose) glycohydrolase ARH3